MKFIFKKIKKKKTTKPLQSIRAWDKVQRAFQISVYSESMEGTGESSE